MISPKVWNFELICASFLPHNVEAILYVPLDTSNGGDMAIWHYRKDGRYYVKSGYRLATDLNKVVTMASEGSSGGPGRGMCIIWDEI